MDKLDGNRSFTYSGGHSFDRAVPDVTYSKNAGNAGFEKKRISFERPPLWQLAVSHEVRACQYEAAFVALHDISEPLGSRERSDKDEHGTGRHSFDLIRVGAEERNLFKMGFAVNFSHACLRPN